MKKFFQHFINDKDKELKWYNTNYFYAFTIVFSLILLLCYFCGNAAITKIAEHNNFWNIYMMTFDHDGVVHVTFNVIIFVLLSLLLERHFGSFTYFIMMIFIIPLANITCFATYGLLYGDGTWSGAGESCVNCFLLGLYLVVVAIYVKQYVLSKRAFLTFIPLGIVIFLMSVDSSVISTPQDFFAHPQMQFMHAFTSNIAGHLAPFVMGIIVAALIYTILFTNRYIYKKINKKRE